MKIFLSACLSLIIAALATLDLHLSYWLKREREYIRTLQLESDNRLTKEISYIKEINNLKSNISSLNYENFNLQEAQRQQRDEKQHPKVVFRVAGRTDGTFAVEQWITSPYFGKVQVDQFQTVFWATYMADLYQQEYDLGRNLRELKALK